MEQDEVLIQHNKDSPVYIHARMAAARLLRDAATSVQWLIEHRRNGLKDPFRGTGIAVHRSIADEVYNIFKHHAQGPGDQFLSHGTQKVSDEVTIIWYLFRAK